jgi:hypothetical protein
LSEARRAAGRQGAFTGVSAEYYVASVLAYRQLHVNMVPQGGSYIDLLVSVPNGEKAIAVQVKGMKDARRPQNRHRAVTRYEWDCGKKVMGANPNLIMSFVDFKDWKEGAPDVYVVRASHVQEYMQREVVDHPRRDTQRDRYRYHPKPEEIEPFRNDWTPLLEELD